MRSGNFLLRLTCGLLLLIGLAARVEAADATFVDCTWDGARGLTSLAGATVAASSPIDALTFTSVVTTAVGITLTHPDDLDGA